MCFTTCTKNLARRLQIYQKLFSTEYLTSCKGLYVCGSTCLIPIMHLQPFTLANINNLICFIFYVLNLHLESKNVKIEDDLDLCDKKWDKTKLKYYKFLRFLKKQLYKITQNQNYDERYDNTQTKRQSQASICFIQDMSLAPP